MTRIYVLLAVLAMTVSSSGCGCCKWLSPQQTVAAAPVCPPAQTCDPCATGTGVTYGMAPTSPMYAPPPQW